MLGLAVGQARRRRGMGVRELARASGVGADRIAALEAGHLDPDFELLLKLADALGVPSAALIVDAEALGSARAGIDIGRPPG